MGIKQKFLALSGLVGVILAVVSIIGYYGASQAVREGVEREITASVAAEQARIEGWLVEKGRVSRSAANLMAANVKNNDLLDSREALLLYSDDPEILGIVHGTERGTFISSLAGNQTGQVNPNDRGWYQEIKRGKDHYFTDPRTSTTTQGLVISAVTPYKDEAGNFFGGVSVNITMDVLDKKVKELKFRGEGNGVIISSGGKVLASSRDNVASLSDVKDMAGVGPHYAEMKAKGSGYLNLDINGEQQIFGYATIPSTGWIIGISAPDAFVFEQLYSMRTLFIILTVAGVLLIMAASLAFSSRITSIILALDKRAIELSGGNLRLPDLAVRSNDELGHLADAFNEMQGNIRQLIKHITATSEQVATSSEELTAGAQQSAQAATDVAQTVVSVADGMDNQVKHVNNVKANVDTVFNDITQMTEKAKRVTENSVQTKKVAESGEKLMQGAVKRMETIESTVTATADVVRKLGENSHQIGAIVETISGIAEQTNLLALNAAIEAARAGEAGRGFSVVAEEVRKLAEQSQNATEEIKERISNIQQDTNAAVTAMEQGTEEVEQGAQAVREVGVQFGEILNMVDSIEAQIKDINEAVQMVSQETNNIVTSVNDIDEISRVTSDHTQTISAAAQEQSASSEEIASASQALATLATELHETTNKFKV